MPMVPFWKDEATVRVRFLPFEVKEYDDTDGWLVSEFCSNQEAWDWARGNITFVEDAYFTNSGDYLIHNGKLER